MKTSGIYKIQSKIKLERVYIGSAVDISERWMVHLNRLRRNKHHSKKLQHHFNKYGEVDLQFSILLGCNKEDLIKTEQYFIDSYKPYFNSRKKAESNMGMKYSAESIEKSRLKRIGRKHSEEAKKRMRENHVDQSGEKNPMFGVHLSGEKHWNYGKHFSKETRKTQSDSHQGQKAWNKGMKMSSEFCIKTKEGIKNKRNKKIA